MLKNQKAHATVPVTDLAKAKAYYVGVLGFDDVEAENQDAVMIKAADGTRFALYATPNTQRGGHTQLGFAVDDIEAEVADLKARGVVFQEYDMPGLKTVNGITGTAEARAAWFIDPDGNTIGLVQLGLSLVVG